MLVRVSRLKILQHAISLYHSWQGHIGLANWNVNDDRQTTLSSPTFQNASRKETLIAGGWMNDKEGQLIIVKRPSNRMQQALLPLSRHHKEDNLEEGQWVGWVGYKAAWLAAEAVGTKRSCCVFALYSISRGVERELLLALAAAGGFCGLSPWVL